MHKIARPLFSAAVFAALHGFATSARAIEIENVGGEAMVIDVTNTSVFNYRFTNRNEFIGNVSTLVDDDYGEWLDRFNVQAGWWRLRLGFRLDVATFFAQTKLGDALPIAAEQPLPDSTPRKRVDFANQIRRELNTRFLSTVYPSKLWIDYTQPGLQITLGDFYAQLGRGLVFSVRKIDEIAVDTTVRGAKAVFNRKFGPVNVGATALAGQMNPVRVDEMSGRRLHGEGSPLFFGFPSAGTVQTFAFNDVGASYRVYEAPRPNYLEDTILAGRLEAGPQLVQVGINGSLLLRESFGMEFLQCEENGEKDCASRYPNFGIAGAPSRLRNTIRTFSGTVNVPSIAKHGDLYVEVAGQQMRDGQPIALDEQGNATRVEDLSGYAVYANANARFGPVTLMLEGKHNRRFFPLSANIDRDTRGFAAPEFSLVSYNQPPTVEPIYVQPIGSPNVCVTGGRARVDVRFSQQSLVYGWFGKYTSYSEIDAGNDKCETDPEKRSNTWDTAVGTELLFEEGSSHANAWVGGRTTSREVPTEERTDTIGISDRFYQEGYIRYDFVKHLTGPFSIQFQGFHRRRYEPIQFKRAWFEGENYTALQWSPHLSAIVGYEYLSIPGCDPGVASKVCHYVSGALQWKSASQEKLWQRLIDTVSVFVGQRRGAIRCVSGVCRQFPPFEGAKLELVSRF